MEKGLVSIITPCYNGEKYLDRYFQSLLNQTYKKLEIIFINDGSTDNTENIVKRYENKLLKNGYYFKYIYQENKGQATAINRGLSIFTGEFLTWPDADDTLEPNSIKKRVDFFYDHPQYDIVRNSSKEIDEKTGNIRRIFKLNSKDNEYIFEDLIFGKRIFYSPVSYMIRSKKFLQVNPNRKIYETRAGQNWQMLLPIAKESKCGKILEVLSNYYVRENSHSREKVNGFEAEIKKIDSHIDILYNVLSEINEWEAYKDKINLKYDRSKISVAAKYDNQKYIIDLLDYEKNNYKGYLKNIKYHILKYKKIYNWYRKEKI